MGEPGGGAWVCPECKHAHWDHGTTEPPRRICDECGVAMVAFISKSSLRAELENTRNWEAKFNHTWERAARLEADLLVATETLRDIERGGPLNTGRTLTAPEAARAALDRIKRDAP